MLRRKFGSNSQNNIIIYQSSKREVPNSVTNDANWSLYSSMIKAYKY